MICRLMYRENLQIVSNADLPIGGLIVEAAESDKFEFLADQRALHPHPERIRDTLFRSEDFLDASDLVQVRYEMLRRHVVEGRSVTQVTQAFGISRQMFYMLLRMFRKQGLYGLLPRRRGPLGPRRRTTAFGGGGGSTRKRIHRRSSGKHVMHVDSKHAIRIKSQRRKRTHVGHKKGAEHD
jgi:hypothetical protein